jgi:hypothetical protein
MAGATNTTLPSIGASALIKRVVAGKKGIDTLFSSNQIDFLNAIGGQTLAFDDLISFGPLRAHRWRIEDRGCPLAHHPRSMGTARRSTAN